MKKSTPPTTSRLMHLEAIRGAASLVVLLHHSSLAFAPWMKGSLDRIPFYWLVNGEGAVYLFFVLSGLVLTRGYMRGRNDRADLLTAAFKRLPRLAVPAGVSILLSAILLRLGLTWHLEAGAISQSHWLLSYGNAELPPGYIPTMLGTLSQTVSVFFYFGYIGLLNTNLWTMAPELFGSFLCFAIAWLYIAFRSREWLACVVALSTALVLGHILGTYAIPFMLGVGLALGLDEQKLRLPLWAGAVLIAVALVLLSSGSYKRMLLGSVIMIAASHVCPVIREFLGGSIGRLLGAYSFPLYLVHPIVIFSVGSFAFSLLMRAGQPYILVLTITFSLTIAASFAAAYPFALLERWWVPTLNRFSRRIRNWKGNAPIEVVH